MASETEPSPLFNSQSSDWRLESKPAKAINCIEKAQPGLKHLAEVLGSPMHFAEPHQV